MMNSFIHQVTTDIIERIGWEQMDRCTMVFPMQRAGLFVKQELAQRVAASSDDTPVTLPHFTTLDALADGLCPLRTNEEIDAVCSLYKIYKQHTCHTLSLDAFYGWGLQLINDFSSADMALVDVEHLMHYTAQAASLDKLVLDDETRQRLEDLLHTTGSSHSVHEYFADLWAKLPAIYRDFTQVQLQKGVGTKGARMRWVIDHFNDPSVQTKIAGRQYVFIGFNYLLAAERRLMERLSPNALFYWDEDANFALDDSVYQYIRDHIQTFGNQLPHQGEHPSPRLTAIACQSSAAQAQYVHTWLMEHHRPGDRTAIVVADESQLQAVVYALPTIQQLPEPINITKGYPLRATHLYQQALQLLNQAIEAHPTVEEILSTTMEDLQNYYLTLTKPEDSWQAVLMDEAYYQTQLVLRQMQHLILTNNFVKNELASTRILRNLVRRKLELVTIPFHGEPVTNIQIIGVLETRLLDFDHILILNVEEDIVPSKASDRSFLPYDLRREYHMATREEEANIYAYNFFRLFRRAQDVTMLFADSFTDKGKRTMSRFMMQMLCSPAYTIQKYRLTESARVVPFEVAPTLFTPTDVRPTHLSPSAISEFIECPRYFYWQEVKKYREVPAEQPMFRQDEIGNLLHATLQQAYLTICHAPEGASRLPQPTTITEAMLAAYLKDEQLLKQALDKAMHNPQELLRHQVEVHSILSMARKVLERDMRQTPFVLMALEKEVDMTLCGMRICGKIDRVDCIEQGGRSYIRIIDYKTGGYEAAKLSFTDTDLLTNPKKRYALQTLIYAQMLGGKLPICPELVFTRKLSETGILQYNKEAVTDYQTQVQSTFIPNLQQLVQRIIDLLQPGQVFPMQEDKAICKDSYCPFHLLCGRETDK